MVKTLPAFKAPGNFTYRCRPNCHAADCCEGAGLCPPVTIRVAAALCGHCNGHATSRSGAPLTGIPVPFQSGR